MIAVRILAIVSLAVFSLHGADELAPRKPRIVISSDFPPVDVIPGSLKEGPPERRSDPDDVQSMVRFLLYANEFRIEGLIAASGTVANVANKQHVLNLLDRYGAVESNLRRHDAAFPTTQALRAITKEGLSGTYAKPATDILGEGKDSEASRFIIDLIDAPNPDPVWFCFWGGTQELAQALWQVRKTRPAPALAKFVSKIRVYRIAQQDGTGQWLMDNFPDLFTVLSRRSFRGMVFRTEGGNPSLGDIAWLNRNVRTGHGALGQAYPESGWNAEHKGVVEGDSPSFLYVLSGANGLSDLQRPNYGGWGGRFERTGTAVNHWTDAPEGAVAISRWTEPRQNDFAARLDWCVQPRAGANHTPTAVLNSDKTKRVLDVAAGPYEKITLSARGSSDPDGGRLAYRWWVYKEAGSFKGDVALAASNEESATLVVPAEAAASTIHVVLEVTDSGSPALTSYRRAVVRVR